jgi:hypothetical protein
MHTPASRTLAPRTSTVTYPGAIEHVRAVRADLRPLLCDCPMADEVVLCASELAGGSARGRGDLLAVLDPGVRSVTRSARKWGG